MSNCPTCGDPMADSSVYCSATCRGLGVAAAAGAIGGAPPHHGVLDLEFELPAPPRSPRDIAIEKLARACTPFMPKHLRLEAHKLGLLSSAP